MSPEPAPFWRASAKPAGRGPARRAAGRATCGVGDASQVSTALQGGKASVVPDS